MPTARLDLDAQPFSSGLNNATVSLERFENRLLHIPRGVIHAFSIFAVVEFFKSIVEGHEKINGLSVETHSHLQELKEGYEGITNAVRVLAAEQIEAFSSGDKETILKTLKRNYLSPFRIFDQKGLESEQANKPIDPIGFDEKDKKKIDDSKMTAFKSAFNRRKAEMESSDVDRDASENTKKLHAFQQSVKFLEEENALYKEQGGHLQEIRDNETKILEIKTKRKTEEKEIKEKVLQGREKHEQELINARDKAEKEADKLLKPIKNNEAQATAPRNFLESIGAAGAGAGSSIDYARRSEQWAAQSVKLQQQMLEYWRTVKTTSTVATFAS